MTASQVQINDEQAQDLLRAAYRIQFDKETRLRTLRAVGKMADRGEPVLQIVQGESKGRVFQILKEIHKHVINLDEEIRVQRLYNMDANISPEIISLATAIGVAHGF